MCSLYSLTTNILVIDIGVTHVVNDGIDVPHDQAAGDLLAVDYDLEHLAGNCSLLGNIYMGSGKVKRDKSERRLS